MDVRVALAPGGTHRIAPAPRLRPRPARRERAAELRRPHRVARSGAPQVAGATRLNCMRPSRFDLGLSAREHALLSKLDSPERIQSFLNALRANHEPDGETVHSVRNVLRLRVAHC